MGLESHVNSSGYPLQIAVGNAVNACAKQHGFRVLFSEHAWRLPDGRAEGFADLVLSNSSRSLQFVVECKRYQEAEWAFLIEDAAKLRRRHAKAFVFRQDDPAYGAVGRRFEWLDLTLDPSSPQSAFCVVPGSANGGRQAIEKVAAELIDATEAIACEARALSLKDRGTLQVYFPVLVTTAKLHTCFFKPEDVSLETGKIANPKFTEVPFVRFRKQLSPTYKVPEIYATAGHHDLARAKENTVFVVNSEQVNQFLSEFELDEGGNNGPYLGAG